jgi:hypothetical protein
MPFRNACLLLALLSITLFAVPTAIGQTDTARVSGVLSDPAGRSIPGATVTISNIATGAQRATTSNNDGIYTLPSVTPGRYRVVVAKQGFREIMLDGLTLNIQDVIQQNFQLEIGSVAQSVTVEATTGALATGDAAIGETITAKQTTELPLNGRNFTELATLVPGVTRGTPTGQASGTQSIAEVFRYASSGSASLSVNGSRPEANNFLLDGIDNNEQLVNTLVFFPPAEAIQEFRVQTSVAPAEFGRAGGAIINAAIKSGTNQIHGSAFEFFRDSALDATPTFAPEKAAFRQHQFGGTLGGPLVKNKHFLFGDYQGLRLKAPLPVELASVPTAKFRLGDFSELLDTSVSKLQAPIQIIDPLTKLPFANNVIPTGRLNPVGLKYLNTYPQPNLGGGRVQQNFLAQRVQQQQYNDFDVRYDWNVRESDQVFARYSFGHDDSTTTSRLPTLPAGTGSGTNFNRSNGVVLAYTHTFSPRLLNETRFGFTRVNFGNTPPFANTRLAADLGIPGANPSPQLGGGALIGGFNSQIEYSGDFGPLLVRENSFQEADIVTYSRAAHTVRIGFNLIRRQLNSFRPNRGKGYFFLNGNGAGPGSTGYETSDLLAGFVNTYSIGPLFGATGIRRWEPSVFGQDDWHVSRRLTLNLGLRYDIYTVPVEVEDRQTNFDPASSRLLRAGQDGNSRGLVPNDYKNFGPRFGFVFDPLGAGKTILRGGYGLYYTVEGGGANYQLTQNAPYSGFRQYNYTDGYRVTLSGAGPLNINDSRLATNPLPSGDLSNLDLNHPANITTFSRLKRNTTPYEQQFNLQVEQQISSSTVASLAYVGTLGRKLNSFYNLNRQVFNAPAGTRAVPQLGDVNVQNTRATSSYNSLQAQIERRFTNGLQFLGSYTWAHAIDDASGPFDGPGPQDINNLAGERGNSLLDVRHRFVFSSLWALPVGRGHHFGGDLPILADALIGGWQTNAILSFQTGLPFNLSTPGQPGDVRPDLVGQVRTHSGRPQQYLDLSAFAQAPKNSDGVLLRPGSLRRNMIYGPGTKQLDLSLFKNFSLPEHVQLQFRAEAFNLTNTPQYLQPNGDITSSGFGQITSTRFSSERQLQFALRISF